MRNGGVKWKSGAETCVFNPAVKCEGDDAPPGNDFVSRIVDKEGTRDQEVEARIAKEFPALVASGVVTVHTKACTPDFTADDLQEDEEFYKKYSRSEGCRKVAGIYPGPDKDLVNLITPHRRGKTLGTLLQTNDNLPREARIKFIRPILDAAIALVPDTGPWIVHADCHLFNVLLHNGAASLSDWGRTIVIEGPITPASITAGLATWLTSLPLRRKSPADRLHEMIEDDWGDFPQHPRRILEALLEFFPSGPPSQATQVSATNAIRGWLPYVLLTQVFTPDPKYRNVLTAANQADLRAKVTEALGGPAVEVVALPPSLGSLAVSPSPTGGVYWPAKYSKGLTRRQTAQRKRSATRRTRLSSSNPKAYAPWTTDRGIKTRRSRYTERFRKICPTATTLPQISRCTKVPTKTLRTVYNRGLAAWRTGHRPGASQQAWGMARVHSFVTHGKTYRTADKDLAAKR